MILRLKYSIVNLILIERCYKNQSNSKCRVQNHINYCFWKTEIFKVSRSMV